MTAQPIQRRSFLSLLGGAAAAWPLAAGAQQAKQIGVLIGGDISDRARQANLGALQEGLVRFGWIEGRNLRTHVRFNKGDPDKLAPDATELVRLAPDVIVTGGLAAARSVQQLTQTIPIVFTEGADPVAAGLMQNIGRPDGHITGFSNAEPSIAGKWLELLEEAAPRVTRVAIIFNPESGLAGPSYISSIEAAARVLGVETIKTPVRNVVDIVSAIEAFAVQPNGGILILPPTSDTAVRDTILHLATQHRLPSIYATQADAAAGGLLAYAADRNDQYRRAAFYVDRLLHGAKVSDLPVQFPTKYQLVVNLKNAKAIDLSIPEAFLLRADEVIE